MFKRSLSFIKGNWVYTLLCPVLIVLDVLIEIELPKITGEIIDLLEALGTTATRADLFAQVRLLMLYTVATLAVGIAANFCAAKASLGFGFNARKCMFNKVQDFSYDNINKFSEASLITRITKDIRTIQTMFSNFLITFIKAPIMIVYALLYALRISKSLSLIFAFAVPALAVVLAVLAAKLIPMVKKMLEKQDRFNAVVRENSNGIRVVKTFVREDFERSKFDDINDELMRWNIKAQKIILFITPFIMMIIYVCSMLTLWRGSDYIVNGLKEAAPEVGTLTSGSLFSFFTYIMSVLSSLMTLMMVAVTMVMARASLDRLREVLDDVPTVRDDEAVEGLTVEDASIEFKNVTYRYSEKAAKPILDNISFKINAGETIGIIGGTGSGKTSLVQLIPRLYDPQQGEVLVGGHNIKHYTTFNLRESVAMVLQQNFLFSGSIRDNIRWGNPDATDEQVEQVCRLAQADGFIREFNEGYDTALGTGGVNLSGGQKQRLCIARALIKHPKILIMDDSTSAVDTQTEASIRTALDSEEFKGTTKLIIAQRITSVMNADRIVIIDDGRLDAVGTHEELLENNRIYQEIYKSQQEGVLA